MWRYHYNSNSYCTIHNCSNNGNNPISVNSGSGSTLAKKAATKYSKKLNNNNGNFSINSSYNQTYTGNPNSNLSYMHCKLYDTSIKTSVKNYSGLRGTRLVNSEHNNGIKANPVNSHKCYKILNLNNIDSSNNIIKNKFNLHKKDQSQHIASLINPCVQEISNNSILNCTYNATSMLKIIVRLLKTLI